ncbi:hypothetical protein [Sinomonas mesophila]|uniref:hypothetical protein n=1 Tax=Sinomonas mesophila TaxID=1531955 RepID=UPI00158B6F56|nr:hypothetical protein [Sinomonas mesophila]
MKSRTLCAQRKMAQRHSLESDYGFHAPSPRPSGDGWMSLPTEGGVAIERGADLNVNLSALGPGDAPFLG